MNWKNFKTINVDETGTIKVHDPNYVAPPAVSSGTVIGTPGGLVKEPENETVLYCRSDNWSEHRTYKVWRASVDGKVMTVRWGKEGAKLQVKTKTFTNSSRASFGLRTTVRAKLAKGYSNHKG